MPLLCWLRDPTSKADGQPCSTRPSKAQGALSCDSASVCWVAILCLAEANSPKLHPLSSAQEAGRKMESSPLSFEDTGRIEHVHSQRMARIRHGHTEQRGRLKVDSWGASPLASLWRRGRVWCCREGSAPPCTSSSRYPFSVTCICALGLQGCSLALWAKDKPYLIPESARGWPAVRSVFFKKINPKFNYRARHLKIPTLPHSHAR